jgi:hypothetical protein
VQAKNGDAHRSSESRRTTGLNASLRRGYGDGVAEDWRVAFTLRPEEHGLIAGALQGLHERAVEHDAAQRLGDRIAVSRDDEHLFLYADSEAAAREARTVVSELLGEHGLAAEGEPAVERWHPVEQRWEDASVALPANVDEVREEHERREADEAAEAQASGFATWEVRVEFASHEEAEAFADRLERDGLPVVRRAAFLLVGANDQDEARALARWLHDELPPAAEVLVEPGGNEVWEVAGNNRFAFLGGLAG